MKKVSVKNLEGVQTHGAEMEDPSAEEFLNAFFDGEDEAIDALRQKRLAIKAKYPKP
jgi:hypothetical protein